MDKSGHLCIIQYICVCIYIYIYIYIHTHTHTHTDDLLSYPLPLLKHIYVYILYI